MVGAASRDVGPTQRRRSARQNLMRQRRRSPPQSPQQQAERSRRQVHRDWHETQPGRVLLEHRQQRPRFPQGFTGLTGEQSILQALHRGRGAAPPRQGSTQRQSITHGLDRPRRDPAHYKWWQE